MMLLKKLPAGTALGITILLYLIGAGGGQLLRDHSPGALPWSICMM